MIAGDAVGATVLAVAKGGEGVKSGPLGLAAILVLCVAVYFLFKSMSKHLKKVRDEFPTDEQTPSTTSASAEPTPTAVAPGTEAPAACATGTDVPTDVSADVPDTPDAPEPGPSQPNS